MLPPLLKKTLRPIYSLISPYLLSRRYAPFVILTEARSGSNLLSDLMRSDPGVRVWGEELAFLNGRDPVAAVRNVYTPYDIRVRAVGFKVFYYHPKDGDGTALWQTVHGIPRMKIVHLMRRNVVRQYVSREVGLHTNQWEMNKGRRLLDTEEKRVTIDVAHMRERLAQSKDWRGTHIAKHLPGLPVLEVWYEDMVADPKRELDRITNFLGIRRIRNPRTEYRQQNPEPLSDLVLNYVEVREAFRGTEYERFFDKDAPAPAVPAEA